MKPFARILECGTDEYYRDPCARPSLSQSIATVMVQQSPLHAYLAHPRLGGVGQAPKDSWDRGTVIHSLVLGVDTGVHVIDASDFRTKAAQSARDEARERGVVPVLRAEYSDAILVAADIRRALEDLGIELTGRRELAIEWDEESSLGPVRCRGMLDHVDLERGLIDDLKTTRCASAKHCARAAADHGYDIQHAAYTSALRKLRPELAGRESFRFLFAEELPEGAPRRAIVTPAKLDGQFRALGAARWQRAVEMWARCLAKNEWPAYTTPNEHPIQLEPPAWAIAQEQF